MVLAERMGLDVKSEQTGSDKDSMTTEMALAIASRSTDSDYSMSVLKRALDRDPTKLALYAELLRIAHDSNNMDEYINIVILLCMAVGKAGSSLRVRMVRVGEGLGASPIWDKLYNWDGNKSTMLSLAHDRGIVMPSQLLK
jgi:hypothetical protein